MPSQCQVILDLPHIIHGQNGYRVFLAVDGALLKGRNDFCPRNGRWCGAQGFEGFQMHLVLHGANLHAFHIFGRFDRAHTIGEVPKTVFRPG